MRKTRELRIAIRAWPLAALLVAVAPAPAQTSSYQAAQQAARAAAEQAAQDRQRAAAAQAALDRQRLQRDMEDTQRRQAEDERQRQRQRQDSSSTGAGRAGADAGSSAGNRQATVTSPASGRQELATVPTFAPPSLDAEQRFQRAMRARNSGRPEHAIIDLQEAAKAGHPQAQYFLGLAYDSGEGVLKSDADAMQWYRRAAERGDLMAASALERKVRDAQPR